MTALPQQGPALRNAWKDLRSQAGAFDLPSIIVGVVVVGILTVGVLASIFGVIPFAQDNAAKQDLASVNTAEGVAKTRIGLFKDKPGLLAAALIGDAHTLAVASNTAGSCYVGVSKSGTGTVFYNSDQSTQPSVLTSATDTGCIDATTRDTLVTSVGGYGGASTATPSAGPSTPTGSTSGGAAALPAGYTWSDPTAAVDTNYVTDPGFEQGNTAGWNAPSGSILKSISNAAGAGVGGSHAIQLVTSSNMTNTAQNISSFDLPNNGGEVLVSLSSPNSAALDVAVGMQAYNADGTPFGGTQWRGAPVVVGNGAAWQEVYAPSVSIPTGGSRKLFITAGGSWYDAAYENAVINIDNVAALSDPPQTATAFSGSTPASGEFSYAWEGAPNASASKQMSTRQVAIPSTFVMGQTYTLQGRGFPANTQVTIGDSNFGSSWTSVRVTTDASGNFTTDFSFPVNTDPNNGVVAGPNTLSFFTSWNDPQLFEPITVQ